MLAILTTHPIQYQVPLWQALVQDGRVPFEVWYLTKHAMQVSHDREFRKSFAWDLDMAQGYPHRFLEVVPGGTPSSFWKCRLREPLTERMRVSNVKALWVQGWQVAAYWQAVWAAKNIGAEVWLRGESNDLAPTPPWKVPIKRVILEQLFRRVDRFLYIGMANRRFYEKFGVDADRLYSAPYAVDNERFAQQAEGIRHQMLEIRRQWNIPENAFCVLFCGKFISKKRPLDVVKAAELLRQDGRLRDLHILFVGSGELSPNLREACNVRFDADTVAKTSNNQIRDNGKPPASFAGFLNQTQISRAYVAANVLVLPSNFGETWGLVVNEAMASGLSCVISDHCGCAEDLGAILPNIIFRCGDIEGLAKGLARIPRSQGTVACDVKKLAKFSLRQTVETVNALYHDSSSPH